MVIVHVLNRSLGEECLCGEKFILREGFPRPRLWFIRRGSIDLVKRSIQLPGCFFWLEVETSLSLCIQPEEITCLEKTAIHWTVALRDNSSRKRIDLGLK